MSWADAKPDEQSAMAAFWYWQVQSRGYWILEEVEHGFCMIEGWDK